MYSITVIHALSHKRKGLFCLHVSMDLDYDHIENDAPREYDGCDRDHVFYSNTYGYGYDDDNDYTEDLDDIYEDEDAKYGNDTLELWTRLRINGEVIMISSYGRMKPFDDSFAIATEGIPYSGTPYRYAIVGQKKCLVHDLVWLAFRGGVPDDKEVRHDHYYTSLRRRKLYSNNIDCLTLQSKTICDVQNILST